MVSVEAMVRLFAAMIALATVNASLYLERDLWLRTAADAVVEGKFDTIGKCRYRLKKKSLKKSIFSRQTTKNHALNVKDTYFISPTANVHHLSAQNSLA